MSKTKQKWLAAIALTVSLVAGGAAAWHFTRPTVSDTLTDDAQTIIDQFEAPKVETPVETQTTPKAQKPVATPREATHKIGTVYGTIRIPTIGLKFPLLEGTNDRDLKNGIGHYETTERPGELGNFSVAGHVDGYIEPFKYLYKLRAGDSVLVDTKFATYTYKVVNDTDCGESGMIVHMSRVEVIKSTPCADTNPTKRMMTMTTCAYPNGEKPPAIHRRIVFAELSSVKPRT